MSKEYHGRNFHVKIIFPLIAFQTAFQAIEYVIKQLDVEVVYLKLKVGNAVGLYSSF